MANEETKDRVIRAAPTKDLFISILVRDVTLRDAIGDLLDNSVDGARSLRGEESYEGLSIKVEFDADSELFRIADNCGGISVSDARNYAFRFGKPDGAERIEHSVGVFGIGMKRALFRLGSKFSIKSTARNSWFVMEVDVDEWKKQEDDTDDQASWTFEFKDYEEDLEEEFPEEERGTIITVSKLHPAVLESFRIENDINELVQELEREHMYNINKGLSIAVNNVRLEAPELDLLESDELRTAYWEELDGSVHARLYAGVSDKDKSAGGWYVFCNKRLVLGPEQTKTTGWGTSRIATIPEYHSQFYRFRGYAFLDAKDPRDLPWNTAKTGMDLDSPVWRGVRQKMIGLMDSVMDFLNQVHYEERDFNNERINDRPLQAAIDNAKETPLTRIVRDQVTEERPHAPTPFRFPEPAERGPEPEPVTWIRYSVPNEQYELVRDHLGLEKPGDVGRRAFEYFFVREIAG